jgi:hypothetical protein
MVWCGAVSGLLVLTGCDADCCGISDRKVHLAGDPPPDSSSCAAVFLDFYEGHSSSCSGMCSVSMQIPGKLVLEQKAPSNAAWSADVSVTDGTGSSQSIDVYAYCPNAEGTGPEYDSCVGFASVEAKNQDHISLSPAPCPGRE